MNSSPHDTAPGRTDRPLGTYALAGGHLEFGESFASCAARESLEETGLVVKELKFLTACNSILADEGMHYVTIFMSGVVDEGMEPEVSSERFLGSNCSHWQG
jgi:8-oxo-dGTP diphosphatase